MRIQYCLALALFCAVPVSADMLNPLADSARQRLVANPDAFDEVDNFCADQKPGAKCAIPGSVFAGGGEGTCKNQLAPRSSVISMECVRQGEMTIDRKFPCVDCIVATPNGGEKPVADPVGNMPQDIFCKGREIGSACMVDLTYQGKGDRHAGVCKEGSQVIGRAGPYLEVTRKVILCQPPEAVERVFTKVSWWKKLWQ